MGGVTTLPRMNTEKIRSITKDLYGFNEVHVEGRLARGYWNDIFPLITDRGAFVMRWYHEGTLPEGVPWEHGLMTFIGRSLHEVPKPVPQIYGSTYSIIDERVAAVFPLMNGSVPDDRQAIQRSAAQVLAQVHRATLNYPAPGPRPGMPALCDLDWNRGWMWEWDVAMGFLDQIARKGLEGMHTSGPDAVESLRELIARRAQITDERTYLRSRITSLAESGRVLVFGPIQGDYYNGNLLAEDDRVTAVLDWDECRPDWQCYELARATWEFCHDEASHTLDGPRALSFVQGYQDANGPVPSREFDLLVLFMRCALFQDLMFEVSEANRGKELTAWYWVWPLRSLESLSDLDEST